MLHPEDFQGLLEMLQKASSLKFSELTIRKADMAVTLRVDGASVQTVQTLAAAQADVPAAAVQAPAAASQAPSVAPAKPAETTAAPQPAQEYSRTINSPIVGTFYSSPGSGKPKFVKAGDTVKAGDKVCIVEAMKLFNEITAPCACTIVKVLAEDGQHVDKDQPLIAIEESK
jgi:acetyl-CoA carboxylase biotin carboxyl carrier protein